MSCGREGCSDLSAPTAASRAAANTPGVTQLPDEITQNSGRAGVDAKARFAVRSRARGCCTRTGFSHRLGWAFPLPSLGSRGTGASPRIPRLGAAGGCRGLPPERRRADCGARTGRDREGPGGIGRDREAPGGDREGPGDTEGHRDTGGACSLLRAAGHRGCPLCRWCRRVPAARRAPQPAHRAPPEPRRGSTADLADGEFVLPPRLCRWGRRVETHVKGATALRMPGQVTVPAS